MSKIRVNIDKMTANYFYAASNKNISDTNHKTYIYCYEHALPASERTEKFGAFHTSDVNYWLNHFTKIYPRNFTAIDYELGDAILRRAATPTAWTASDALYRFGTRLNKIQIFLICILAIKFSLPKWKLRNLSSGKIF